MTEETFVIDALLELKYMNITHFNKDKTIQKSYVRYEDILHLLNKNRLSLQEKGYKYINQKSIKSK